MKKILTTVAALIGVMSALADLALVDIDGSTSNLIGSTTTVQMSSTGDLQVPARWDSITYDDTLGDVTGVLPDPMTSTDVYLRKSGLSIPVSGARYIQVHYVVNGAAFTGDAHRLFPVTSGGVSGGINIANDNLIDGTTGAHSFILDMFSGEKGYEGGGGNWTEFRWDMWNESSLTANAGKSITIDKLVYGNDLVAIPEPATLGLITAFGGGVLFIRRRFMM